MHDIEPHFKWRDEYVSSEDEHSPFYGYVYDEFTFRNKIYNYFIHPQWDFFGSSTLYGKIIYVDYEEHFACIQLLGEWNDCLHNDIMFLKREIADKLNKLHITKFIVLCDQVLNFHPSDDCYYEEWFEDVLEDDGWVSFINLLPHVESEMSMINLHHFIQMGGRFNEVDWQRKKPKNLFNEIEVYINSSIKGIAN